ncbi:MAG: TonB family protein, partial [Thermoanaerobaculia bacterium]
IGLNWFPIPGVPVNPIIRFRILRDGTVTDVQVARSSGLPYLDRRAQRAVIASSPLPPLPADYPGSDAGAAFEFE